MLGVNDDEIEAPGAGGVGRDSRILLAEDLHKSYGVTQALRGLSFSLSAGRVLGFLGPNGAGKTTAIRILSTILEPSSGQFFVDGISSDHPDQIRRKMGILPESLSFFKRLNDRIDTWPKACLADGCRSYPLATPAVNSDERPLRSQPNVTRQVVRKHQCYLHGEKT